MSAPKLKTTNTGGKPLWFKPTGKYVCSMLLLALIALPCLSQTIGNWTFTNTMVGTGGTHNTVSVANFSAAIPTKVFNSAGEYYGEDGWPTGAINTGAYVEFSISPNTGYQLDLSSISLRIRRSNTGTPQGSGPTSWSLRSSLDGFAADINSNSLVHTYNNYTVPLGSSFLNVYTTITFRLYGYNTTIASGGLSRVVLDEISIQGIGEVLPITLSLTGIQALRNNDKNIAVKWQANNVQEGSVFNVERSVNGTDFTTINRFTERESKSAGSYSYEDHQVPGNVQAVFYRIKINEPNGWTYFSWLVKVNNKTITQALIDYTTIQGPSLLTSLQIPEKGVYAISLISMNGAVLQQQSLNLEAGVHVVTLPLNGVAHGTHVIRLSNKTQLSSKKFVW
jgi:hypothetical protein